MKLDEFTDEELQAVAAMCEASVPTCVYADVLSAVRKITKRIGRPVGGGSWFEERERRWHARPKTDLQKGGGL